MDWEGLNQMIFTNRYSMLTSYSKWLVKMELGKHDCTFIQMTWYTLSGYTPPSMTLTQVYLAIVNVQELLHGYKKSQQPQKSSGFRSSWVELPVFNH